MIFTLNELICSVGRSILDISEHNLTLKCKVLEKFSRVISQCVFDAEIDPNNDPCYYECYL